MPAAGRAPRQERSDTLAHQKPSTVKAALRGLGRHPKDLRDLGCGEAFGAVSTRFPRERLIQILPRIREVPRLGGQVGVE